MLLTNKRPTEHALRDETGQWVERDSRADYANYEGRHRLYESNKGHDQVYLGCPACYDRLTH